MQEQINHPQHYEACRFTCEPADLTVRLPHPIGSAIEYILRAPYKGSEATDLRKAAWWLQKALDTEDIWDNDCISLIDYGFGDEDRLIAAAYAMCTKSELVTHLLIEGSRGPLILDNDLVSETIHLLKTKANKKKEKEREKLNETEF